MIFQNDPQNSRVKVLGFKGFKGFLAFKGLGFRVRLPAAPEVP